MSGIIKLLPDNIANQIAAGEVIQRPASVVKELMENAIDAGATKIDVNIKDSGKTLIQIVDDGSGMTAADAELCFERHATSKVSTANDLFALSTKGFRGEALASISAISHVLMHTKRAKDDLGTRIIIEGSKLKENKDAVVPDGTAFEIKNLFFNVPARRAFLKSEKVEFGHIVDEFQRVALAHPDIQFNLHHNGTVIHHLPAGVLRKRIVDILGRSSNDKLVPINESTQIVELSGFVLKPEFSRKSRGEQFLFVNQRFFKSSYFNHAVNKAFEGLLKDNSYPGYFLYLQVDPAKIDVNVHPTKTEIKFEEEKYIYSILLSSIRQALGKYNISPTLDFERETSFDIPHSMHTQPTVQPEIKVNPEYNPFKTGTSSLSGDGRAIRGQGFGTVQPSQKDWEEFYSVEEESTAADTPLIEEEEIEKTEKYLFKEPYLIAAVKNGFMLVHIKRAVEQIVYNNLINSFINNPIPSQQLLFPVELELSSKELLAWDVNNSILKQLGFDGAAEKDVLKINAVPSVLQDESIGETIGELLEIITYRDIEKGDLAHNLIGSIAKGASMKRMDLRDPLAQKEFIQQLFQCENHLYTPRNKKIIEQITLGELQKKFD